MRTLPFMLQRLSALTQISAKLALHLLASFSLGVIPLICTTTVEAALPTVDAGASHTLALKSDSTVWAWGLNNNGELGNNTTTISHVPLQVSGLSDVVEVSAGISHTVALKSDGTVWAWGYNGQGQLGSYSPINALLPLPALITNVVAVSAGGYHTVALKSDGTVWTWGMNYNGQLCNNSTVFNSFDPVQVTGLTDVVAISAGPSSTLAVKSDGTVWACGGINNPGSTGIASVPAQVLGLSGVVAVSAGTYHKVALKSDGTVWAWGDNTYYHVSGNGLLPAQVPGLIGVVAVSAGDIYPNTSGGGTHTLALKSDGTVWAWGYNGQGQLGNNSTTKSLVPVQVLGLSSVVAVSAGGANSMALKSDGTVWAWGYNLVGQLGNNSTATSLVPVQVVGPGGQGFLNLGQVGVPPIIFQQQLPSVGVLTDGGIPQYEPPAGVKKKLILSVHGWNSDPSAWANEMNTQILSHLASLDGQGDPAEGWVAKVFDWHVASGQTAGLPAFLPKIAHVKAGDLGVGLGKLLAIEEWDVIHFIAHSAGSNLVEQAADSLRQFAKVKHLKTPLIHTTFLDAYEPDAYDPNSYKSCYGYASDWAEQYVDRLLPYGYASLLNQQLRDANLVLPFSYNFDVTSFDQSMYDPVAQHAWPYQFYKATMDVPQPKTYGFSLALEGGNTEFSNNPIDFARGDCKDVASGGACAGYAPKSSALKCNLQSPLNSTGQINLPMLLADSSVQSQTGTVSACGLSSLCMTTGSPVWVAFFTNTDEDFDAIQLKHRFTSSGDGVFSVFMDDQLVYKSSEANGGTEWRDSGLISTEKILPGQHVISFRLDHYTSPSSAIEISDFKVGIREIVTGLNQAPIANAGSSLSARLGSLITLNASLSSDPDNGPLPLRYRWHQVNGPSATLSSDGRPVALITPAVPGMYRFELTVNDGRADSSASSVNVTVPILGDIDGDSDVDNNDLAKITSVLNQPVSGPNDLRDLDGDGKITALDSRKLVTLCTRPRCATR